MPVKPDSLEPSADRRATTAQAGGDCAQAALASLRQHALPVTPHSFAVLYEYHRGGMPELNRFIEILLTNKVGLNEERLSSLHAKFLGGPEAYLALRETSERMQQTIADVLALMHDAGQDASRFNAAIGRVAGQIVNQEASIEHLIRGLLNEAQDVVSRTRQMEAELTRNAELMKSLQRTLDDTRREALTDGLTALANRRHFDQTMQTLAGRAMNNGGALSLVMLDIDHFKRINDTFGHPVGDQVLQLVAATVRSNLGAGDFAARYGGEEFALLLPGADTEAAIRLADKLREAFASNRVVIRESRQPIGVVTISAGVATFHAGESLADWISRADAALYAAKQAGRNTVMCADPAPAG